MKLLFIIKHVEHAYSTLFITLVCTRVCVFQMELCMNMQTSVKCDDNQFVCITLIVDVGAQLHIYKCMYVLLALSVF